MGTGRAASHHDGQVRALAVYLKNRRGALIDHVGDRGARGEGVIERGVGPSLPQEWSGHETGVKRCQCLPVTAMNEDQHGFRGARFGLEQLDILVIRRAVGNLAVRVVSQSLIAFRGIQLNRTFVASCRRAGRVGLVKVVGFLVSVHDASLVGAQSMPRRLNKFSYFCLPGRPFRNDFAAGWHLA
ncbi:hypothetical protein D3C77_485920 [compost metagenome]